MFKKSLKFLMVLVACLSLTVPAMADQGGCIPHLKWGYSSYYDGRFGGSPPHPNGGWKFQIAWPRYDPDGNEIIIKQVRFTNQANGLEIEAPGSTYNFLNEGEVQEYTFWLGHNWVVLGPWEIEVKMKIGKYYGYIEVTEDHLNLPRPDPVEIVSMVNDGTDMAVTFTLPQGGPNWPVQYRFRVFDDQGNFAEQWTVGWSDVNPDDTATINVPSSLYSGNMARIEARIFYPVDQMPAQCTGSMWEMMRAVRHFVLPELP